jgi:hypothetical protein
MAKITAVLSVAVLVLIAACGRGAFDELDEERFGRIEGTGEFFEITWLMEEQEEEEEGVSSWFRQIVEQRFNVAIVPASLEITGDYRELLAFLASGQFPDCGMVGSMVLDPYAMWNGNLIRTLPEEMIRTYMPNYSKFLDEEYVSGWKMLGEHLVADREHEREYLMLSFPSARDEIPQEAVSTRIDWARAVGIEFPDYERDKRPINRDGTIFWLPADITVDWWERLLAAYLHGDPDGNGQIDTIPWPAESQAYDPDSWMWTGVRGAFGPVEGPMVENGVLTMAEVSDSYRQWCKLASRWVSSGLVDKENFERNAYFAQKKIAQGLIAAAPVYLWSIDQAESSHMPPMTTVTEKGAEAVVLPSLVGPGGDRGPYVSRSWSRKYFIGKRVEDEKLKRILQIIEFLYFSGEENFVFAHFGKPGIHFSWEEEPWNSQPIPKAPEEIPSGYPKIGGFGDPRYRSILNLRNWIVGGWWPSINREEIPRINAYTRELVKFEVPMRINRLYDDILSGESYGYTVKWPHSDDLFYEKEFNQLMEEHGGDLERHRLGFFWRSINSWMDVDAEWDDYVEGWKSSGGDELLEAIEKLPITEEVLRRRRLF